MANVPNISDAEWVVMRVLWDKSPGTANDVIAALATETDWSPLTI
ncbi:MAG TPA: BlaI/MecI/CopY family transcriptional regulator, partial [Candidatus Hydrogenedentes bacterium]|nr:BlaI/MecI/CopY family transcriptional regulator [Candidatus Hydrogenedentota bacterium]